MIFLAPATVLESLVSRTAGQTEAVIRVAEDRNIVEVVAVGNSGVGGVEEPATAAEAAVGRTDQIEAPLPHVPAHVINSQLVRGFRSHRFCAIR